MLLISSTHSFKKYCQFLLHHQGTYLLYMNHNQNIHNYSLLDSYYFFWGMFCLRKLLFLSYEPDVYIWEFVSGKMVFLIHLINALAYPTDSWGCYRPDVYIWTWTIPVVAVVWRKLSLRSSFLRERFSRTPNKTSSNPYKMFIFFQVVKYYCNII